MWRLMLTTRRQASRRCLSSGDGVRVMSAANGSTNDVSGASCPELFWIYEEEVVGAEVFFKEVRNIGHVVAEGY